MTILNLHPIPLASTLLLFCVALGCETPLTDDTNLFQIASSSMAPGLLGPSVQAQCRTCSHTYLVAAETINLGFRTRCYACGGLCDLGSEITPGDSVSTQNFERHTPERFERVVFRDRTKSGAWQVKRVWGLPNETIHFEDGDLWIDGQRVQKTLRQLRQVAMPVAKITSRQVIQANATFEWQYRRPAPVALDESPPEAWMTSSDILNDFEYNQGLSQPLYAVDDFMVSIVLGDPLSTTLSIQLRYRNQTLLIDVQPQSNSKPSQPVSPAQAIANASVKPVSCVQHITLAICDGRLLIETDLEERTVALDKEPPEGVRLRKLNSAEAESTGPQVMIQCSEHEVTMESVEIRRDQYLVHSNGKYGRAEYGRVPEAKVFVLGDNLAASVDSRQTREFVRVVQIVGTIPD